MRPPRVLEKFRAGATTKAKGDMNHISFLRGFATVSSLIAGSVGVFLVWVAFYASATSYAPWLVDRCAVFLGSAVLLLWVRQQLPDLGPPRKRGKGLLDRLLNVFD